MEFTQLYVTADSRPELDDEGLRHLLSTRTCSRCHQPVPYTPPFHPVFYTEGWLEHDHLQKKLSRRLFWIWDAACDDTIETTDKYGWLGTTRIIIIAKKVVFHKQCWTDFIYELYVQQKREEEQHDSITRSDVQSPGSREEADYPLLLCTVEGRPDVPGSGTTDANLGCEP